MYGLLPSAWCCAEMHSEFIGVDFRKTIKLSYLQAQKELCELPLPRYIRNESFVRLEPFAGLSEVFWIPFYDKIHNLQVVLGLCAE